MNCESLVTALLALPDESAWQGFLDEHRDELTPRVVVELERQADRLRLENPGQALRAADATRPREAAVSPARLNG